MQINKVWAVYFSPCGSTKRITTAIADSISKRLDAEIGTVDYTLPPARTETYIFSKTDLVICGTPVYAGRIPNKLLPFVQSNLIGNETPAVPIAVYGNRSYDDALVELRNVMENKGFYAIAGAGIAAMHVFTDKLAGGRPDSADMEKIIEFSNDIAGKINKTATTPESVFMKGNNPPTEYYTPKGTDGKPAVFLKAKPKTETEKCNHCCICVQNCPMGAINIDNPAEITGTCIKCHACVNKCPQKAKYFDDAAFLSHKSMLEQNFTLRSESIFFL